MNTRCTHISILQNNILTLTALAVYTYCVIEKIQLSHWRILFLLKSFFLVLIQKKKPCDVWQPTLTIVGQTAPRKGQEKEEGGEKALLLFSVLRLAA